MLRFFNKSKKKRHNSPVSGPRPQKPGLLSVLSLCFSDDPFRKLSRDIQCTDKPDLQIDFEQTPTVSFLTSQTDFSSFICHEPFHPDSKNPVRQYPLDKPFILGENHKIVAKITEKRIIRRSPNFATSTATANQLIDSILSSEGSPLGINPELEQDMKREIFSKYEKGIKADDWHEVTPENVAIHIAERLNCSIMVDALCGNGGNTIQFAKYCDYVLGIDIEPVKTLNARDNAEIYGVQDKIDFITVDFLKLKNLMGDVVFLGPSDIRENTDEPFNIFKHVEPNLRDLLAKSLEISHNIALLLPKDTNFEELAELFNVSLRDYGLYSERFCIEIEKIVNSCNRTECIVIYFGNCSSIKEEEEYEAIYELLTSDRPPEWSLKFPLQKVVTILSNIGIRKSFELFVKIQEKLKLKAGPAVSLFEAFLDDLVERNYYTKASLKKLLDEDYHYSLGLPIRSHRKRSSHSNPSPGGKASQLSPSKQTTEDNTSPGGKVPQLDPVSEEIISKFVSKHCPNENNCPNGQAGSFFERAESNVMRRPRIPSETLSDLSVSSYSISSDYFGDDSRGSSPLKPDGPRASRVTLSHSDNEDGDGREDAEEAKPQRRRTQAKKPSHKLSGNEHAAAGSVIWRMTELEAGKLKYGI